MTAHGELTQTGGAMAFRGPWAPSTPYRKNDVTTYLGGVYVANADFTSGAAFVAANWTQLGVSGSAVVSRTVVTAARPDGANITDTAWHDLVGFTLPAMAAQPRDVILRLVVRPRMTGATQVANFQVVTNDANLTQWLNESFFNGYAADAGTAAGSSGSWPLQWNNSRVVFERLIVAGTAVPALKARVQASAVGTLDFGSKEAASGEFGRIEQVYA